MKDQTPQADLSGYAEKQFNRRTILQAGFLFPGAFLAACAAPEQKTEWSPYNSPNYLYSVKYPKSWKTGTLVLENGKSDIYVPDPNNLFKMNIEIYARSRNPGLSLEDSVNSFLKEEKETVTILDPLNKLFIVSTPDSEDMHGLNKVGDKYAAYHLEFDFPDAVPEPQKRHKVIFIAGDKIWYTHMHGYPTEIEKQMPVFKRMLDTFQLKQPTI